MNHSPRFLPAWLILTLLFGYSAAAQSFWNPIVDAPQLSAMIAADTGSVAQQDSALRHVLAFMNTYFPGTNLADLKALQAGVADNAYLSPLFKNLKPGSGNPFAANAVQAPAAGIDIQAGSLLSASNLSDVLATFIADRFKQELEIAYLQKLTDWLTNKTDNLLPTLLPNALVVLSNNDPAQFTTFFEALKEAFEKDIHTLPTDFGTYLALDPFNFGNSKLYFPAVVLYQGTVKVMQGNNPYSTLATLNQDTTLLDKMDTTAASYIRLLALATRTLIDPAKLDAPAPLSATTVKNDLGDLTSQQLFVGLLLLKEKSEFKNIFFKKKDLYTLLNDQKTAATIRGMASWLIKMANTYEDLDKVFVKIRTQMNNSKPVYSPLITGFVSSFLNTATVTLSCPVLDSTFFPRPGFKNMLTKLTDLSQIAADVADSNYGLALTHIIAALPDFIGSNHQSTIDALKNFGYFAVAIAKAKTNADLESALSSAALPIGSYRIKRNSFKNISLNAWAGGFLGTQHFTGTVPSGVKQDNWLGGFTAPVGVAYSWGQVWYSGDKKGKLKGYSNTILLNVIDIGSITAFRLTHDSTATLPDFKWQNILAPGIFYVFGWRSSPLSLGGGVQYGPQLRGFTDNSAIVLPPAISFRLFLAVDIPLFNFYTRTQPTDAPK